MSNSINAQADTAMANFLLKARSAIQDVTKMVLIEFGDRLVVRSPVGDPSLWKRQPPWVDKNYIPGKFKNNWQLGVDVIPQDIFYASDASGQASRQRIRQAIPRWPAGKTYYFANNLSYARVLENGHSSQCPPGGMVTLTSIEWNQIVRECEVRYINGERPVNKADI